MGSVGLDRRADLLGGVARRVTALHQLPPCNDDADDDGIDDIDDNCRVVENPEQVDRDEDGTGDLCDLDLDGDAAVGALLERRRDTDAQAIRQLLRNARREADRGKPPAAARSLFRLLRDMDLAEALPPLPES